MSKKSEIEMLIAAELESYQRAYRAVDHLLVSGQPPITFYLGEEDYWKVRFHAGEPDSNLMNEYPNEGEQNPFISYCGLPVRKCNHLQSGQIELKFNIRAI